MIKLVITPILDPEGERAQGILYSNLERTLVFFPKNTKVWSIALKKYYTLNTNEVFSPQGSSQVPTRDQALRLLTLIQGEQVIQETAEEMASRIKENGSFSVGGGWVSQYFNRGEERLTLSPLGEVAVEELLKSAGSRYSKTPKGKLAQKRWRESSQGKETLEVRRTERKEEKTNFKAASAWIKANPGSTFSDWENLQKDV